MIGSRREKPWTLRGFEALLSPPHRL